MWRIVTGRNSICDASLQLRKGVIIIGKKNNVIINYLSKKERFADFLNALLYKGEQLIIPDKLEQVDSVTFESVGKQADGTVPKRSERRNDLSMRYGGERLYRLYIAEMNEKVHYAMPLRNLEYVAAWYKKQYELIRKEHILKNDFGSLEEKMSGLNRDDRLMPVTIIWLYHGEEKWDGPRNLRDMVNLGGENEKRDSDFTDFTPILICANELEGFSEFKTELGLLIKAIRYKNTESGLYPLLESGEFDDVDEDTYEAISVLLDMPSIWRNRENYRKRRDNCDSDEMEVSYDMCTAVREHEARIRRETREQVEKEMCTAVKEHEARIRRETREQVEKEMQKHEASLIIDHAKSVMLKLKCSAEEALSTIGIEEDEQPEYLKALV